MAQITAMSLIYQKNLKLKDHKDDNTHEKEKKYMLSYIFYENFF